VELRSFGRGGKYLLTGRVPISGNQMRSPTPRQPIVRHWKAGSLKSPKCGRSKGQKVRTQGRNPVSSGNVSRLFVNSGQHIRVHFLSSRFSTGHFNARPIGNRPGRQSPAAEYNHVFNSTKQQCRPQSACKLRAGPGTTGHNKVRIIAMAEADLGEMPKRSAPGAVLRGVNPPIEVWIRFSGHAPEIRP